MNYIKNKIKEIMFKGKINQIIKTIVLAKKQGQFHRAMISNENDYAQIKNKLIKDGYVVAFDKQIANNIIYIVSW